MCSAAVTNTGPSGWRYAFWIEAGLHGATFLGFALFYWPIRRSDYPKMSFKQYFWLIDPVGSLLYMAGATLILIALNWAGGKYAWSSAFVAAPLTIGLVILALFGLYGMLIGNAGLTLC